MLWMGRQLGVRGLNDRDGLLVKDRRSRLLDFGISRYGSKVKLPVVADHEAKVAPVPLERFHFVSF